jgi:cutinase
MSGSISALNAEVRARIAGTVLYGYTKNKQNNLKIPNYPPENTKVFCGKQTGTFADGVCNGALNVNLAHFAYLADGTVATGAKFLVDRINAASKG